jgi:anthranilate phosphoribosyltransferase
VAVVSGAGAALAHHGRKNSWQTYGKRDATSAFGVDHSDNPNGQHRETEN